MALGCAFIFVLVLMCWRRRARKQRAAATANFAAAKRLNHTGDWRYRLARFGERLFGHRRGQRWMLPTHHQDPATSGDVRMEKLRLDEAARVDRELEREREFDRKLRLAEDARHERDMDRLLDSYARSRAASSRAPSPLPSLHSYEDDRHSHKGSDRSSERRRPAHTRLAEESLYSQVTGQPRRAPEPRQPVRDAPLAPRARPDVPSSRFSGSTTYSSWLLPDPPTHPAPHVPPTPAQEYARSVSALGHAEQAPQQQQRGAYWLQPSHTGGSGGSRNPFLR